MIEHDYFMRQALDKARYGIQQGQAPFGACIVYQNTIIALEHNIVRASVDSTAHAEIVALRQACKVQASIDLSGSILYTTCEPCPMCFAACHWARIACIVYGASIDDAAQAGFNELCISAQDMQHLGNSSMQIISDVLAAECKQLFIFWLQKPDRLVY